MPRVVAVIVAYWPDRHDNVRRIVNDIKNGTVVPDRIIVLNNNKDYHTLEIDGVDVINSDFNSRCRGKFLVALMDVADYYLIFDDDCSLKPKTLEHLMDAAHPKCCYAWCGANIVTPSTEFVYPERVTEEIQVDFLLGSALFVSFYAIVRMLMIENKIRLETKWKHQAEDVLIGLANHTTVIPMPLEDGSFFPLGWGSQAMAYGSDGTSEGGLSYLIMRQEFMNLAIQVIKDNPIPEF